MPDMLSIRGKTDLEVSPVICIILVREILPKVGPAAFAPSQGCFQDESGDLCCRVPFDSFPKTMACLPGRRARRLPVHASHGS